ncbi:MULTISPECIES: cytochrome c oxidase subunit II [unclassified Sphingobium]|uniref:cytochrome c oxidase subunit II n=1 Tax=unclassified Sphingobium TaxID=2611147 RepID=UPI002224379C|nr:MULTISPECIES: cytochrome c oxidase subunit II [unclassified Sphingobium]MCW2349855.1 cytochrome c oxidase subunit 2 [Sphingobium sp. B12D2B]MCW2368956.1 cytochrome c oxidase subunit 2 [Sphingobium sp. B11D3D]
MTRRINGFMVAIALGLSTLAPSSAFGQAEQAAAPAASTAEAAPAAAAAPAAPAAPAFDHAAPVEGVGQPAVGETTFQKQVTSTGNYALWMHNVILLPVITVISLFVLGLLLWVVVRYRRAANPVPSRTSHNTAIEIVWTLAPVLILIGIAIPSIDLLAKQFKPAPANAITLKVTGYQWYWGYEYPDLGIGEYVSNMLPPEEALKRGEPRLLGVDNRVVLPVGVPIKAIITAADVIHSFSIPAFWVKEDAVPGRLNEKTFTIEKEGVYYGVCSELCGARHGFMPISIEAVSPERFAQWVRSQGGQMPGDAAAPAAAAEAPAAAPAPANAETPAAAPATAS